MAINLVKGQKINLKKENGTTITKACVGVNWGAKKGMFGIGTTAVDLDASAVLYDGNKNIVETIYYGNKVSRNRSVVHSGDDLTGDTGGDDGLDNEIITVDFANLPDNVEHVAFVLNSFNSVYFDDIPYSSIRIFEGTPNQVGEVFARYEITKDPSFKKKLGMVMGVFYKRNNEWKFNAIGVATDENRVGPISENVRRNFL